MANYWWCAFLFRIVYPTVAVSAAFLRPTLTSYIYLVLACYIPFYSVPMIKQMQGKAFIKVSILCSLLTFMLVYTCYLVLFSPTEKEFVLENCSPIEVLLRSIGIVDFLQLETHEVILWVLPEPLMLLLSVLIFLVIKKISQDETFISDEEEELKKQKEGNRLKVLRIITSVGKYVVTFMFCTTSALRPSIIGAVYYLAFLVIIIYWALNNPLKILFARFICVMLPLLFVNLTCLYLYQFQFFQDRKEQFDPTGTIRRLFNFIDLKTYKDCDNPKLFIVHDQHPQFYGEPICLYLLYYFGVLVVRQIFQAEDGLCNLIIAFCHRDTRAAKWRRAFNKIKKVVQEEKALREGKRSTVENIGLHIENVLRFLIGMSYLIGNFTMMIWAITWVGWKGIILLTWALLIWLIPFRKKMMLYSSPFLVIYVLFLLSVAYIYSINITENEVPSYVGIFHLSAGTSRVIDQKEKFKYLLIRSLFGFVMFFTMRQLIHEIKSAKRERELIELAGSNTESLTITASNRERKMKLENIKADILRILSYFWLWVVLILMIWMNFWGETSLFRIVFVGLALIVIIIFQLFPYKFFKKFIKYYWWVVIIYSTFNLVVLYAYQISVTRRIMLKFISKEDFDKYGFEVAKERKALSFALANPMFFQIAVVIQQNYLQDSFNKLTSPRDPLEVERDEEALRQQKDSWRKSLKIALVAIKHTFFGLMEVHIRKICMLVGWYMCIFEMSALFVPVVLLFTASCIFNLQFRNFVLFAVSLFLQVLIMLRLVYMMYMDEGHEHWNMVGQYERNGKMFNKTLNTMDWLGFHESKDGPKYADFEQISWNFYYVGLVTMLRVTNIRMSNYRVSRGQPDVIQLVLFPDITCDNYHTSFVNLVKFWVNYFFFKFGYEVCCIACTIVMWQRMDVVAIGLSFILLFTFWVPRRTLKRIWIAILFVTFINVPIQYIATLGLWPNFWENSLVNFWSKTDLHIRIQQFCHLSNMAHPPVKYKISLDFWFLLLCSRQWVVFKKEKSAWIFKAGDNEDVSIYMDDITHKNPVPDFVTYTRYYLDIIKRIFFISWFYVALISTFLAGALMPTLFSFGYILAAFYFLWQGSDVYLLHPKTIKKKWNILMGYSIFVMMARVTSQIVGCILNYEEDLAIDCMWMKSFSVGCVDKYDTTKHIPNLSRHGKCHVTEASLGLGYDIWCFFFIVFQQRIFKSYHFFHIVNDAKAQTILGDRGAQLIEESRQKRRKELDQRDTQIQENCKKKLTQLTAAHKKVLGNVYEKRKQNHWHMQKSADYYLFDESMLRNSIPLLPPRRATHDDVDPFDPMRITYAFSYLSSHGIVGFLADRNLRKRQRQALRQGKTIQEVKKMTPNTTGASSRPGTSRTVEFEELSTPKKILNFFILLLALFECLVVSITGFFDRKTNSFRNILTNMNLDRKALKEQTDYNEGTRHELTLVWRPTQSYTEIINNARAEEGKLEHQRTILHSIYLKLLRSLWFVILTYTEWWCYCTIILIQATRSNMMSLPIILFTFGWGVLTVPKPTRTFWIVSIAYTLIMIAIKIVFLLDVIDWDYSPRRSTNLYFPPQFLGITKELNLYINLVNIAVLFLHRSILQLLGLWKAKSYRRISLIDDGTYAVSGGKFVGIKNPSTGSHYKALVIKTTPMSLGQYFPKSLVHGFRKYGEGARLFIQHLIKPTSAQIPVDVYTPMFLCDLVNLLLLTFSYGSFMSAEDHDGLIDFIYTNRVPVSFIIVFLAYILLMVIDRAIYMRRNRFAKIIYYYLQVFFIHVWFFILYPFLTYRQFNEIPVIQIFYLFKAMYFLLSAYQIRNGYPSLISYHTLWHGYGILNRFGYKIYTWIYYFFEIRLLLDWMWSESCLSMMAWFKMEEITNNIFDQRCEQDYEAIHTSPAGLPKRHLRKYIVGTPLILALIFTVIFPFILFSLGGQVGLTTHPKKFVLDVYMGSTEPVFQAYANEELIKTFTSEEYKNLTSLFNNIPFAQELFGNYEAEDVISVTWSTHSLTTWKISPGAYKELIERVLDSKKPYVILLEISYSHIGHGGTQKNGQFKQRVVIPPLPNEQRRNLIALLQRNETIEEEVWLQYSFPKFMQINKDGEANALSIMAESRSDQKLDNEEDLVVEMDDQDSYKKLLDPRVMRNLKTKLSISPNGDKWWELKEECLAMDNNYYYYLKDLVHNSCDRLVIYVFNERVFSHVMNLLTQSGILGMYLIYFFVVIEIIRGFRIEVDEIWIEDLPNSMSLWDKCMEVCIARDMGNYELEELLYSELVFIMRSRETLIRITRQTEPDDKIPSGVKASK